MDDSKRIIAILRRKPMRFGKLKKLFGIRSKKDLTYLQNILLKMQVMELIYYNGTTYEIFPSQYKVVTIETFQMKKSGYNQACFKDASGKIIPIQETDLNGALIGDTVVINKKKRQVLSILKRQFSTVLCEVIVKEGIKYLKPLRILGSAYLKLRISEKNMKSLVEGDIVSVTLDTIKYDNTYEAYFKERVGHKDDPNITFKVIALNHGFNLNFSEEALMQAHFLPTEVSNEEIKKRMDLRKKEIFTIDGANTKDMDDAISLQKLPNGHYELGVHIADVSHYVRAKSPLWQEAVARGTSLYMVNTVVPMLPHLLSNGICSLNEDTDRLTLSCLMELDDEAKILDYKVVPSVIHSKKKMAYEEVEKVLNKEPVESSYDVFSKTLELMNDLAQKMKNKRQALPFESNDIDYSFDENKNIIDFKGGMPTKATNIIEQFMIAANVCLSKYATYLNLPIPYRIHEKPSSLKIEETFQKLCNLHYNITNCLTYDPYQTLYNILEKYQGTTEYSFLSDTILKSMKKAKYSSYNEGHYALKEEYYSHFTSPIRRLPDLLLHYQISTVLEQTYPFKTIDDNEMETLCITSSFMERQADLAEKEADQYVILKYMNNHRQKFYKGYVKEINTEGIVVITKGGIKGTILYTCLPSDISVSLDHQAIYYHKHLAIRTGNSLLLGINDLNLMTNEVFFDLKKNLSLRQYFNDYSLSLRKNIS